MSGPLTVIGIGPFLGSSVLVAATTPSLGKANSYDSRTLGTSLNVTLPDLASGAVTAGSWMLLEKIKADTTAHPINFACVAGQSFTSGDTAMALLDGGQACIVQVISNDGVTKQWKQLADFGAVGPAVRAAARKAVVANPSSPSSLTINIDITDVSKITALANALSITISGTPYDEQILVVYLTDNGTSQRVWFDAVKFGVAGNIDALPTVTPAGRRMRLEFVYDAGFARFILIKADTVGYAY